MQRLHEEIADPENGDKFMVDETVSTIEIKRNFIRYSQSLKRFHVSAEQFFDLLSVRNACLEQVEEETKAAALDQVWNEKN